MSERKNIASKPEAQVTKVTSAPALKAATAASTKQSVSLKGVKIVSVTGADAIAEIAASKAINPQLVFVHVTFEYNGEQYQSSNQLRFFREKGYKALLDARKNGTTLDITLTIDSEKADKDPLMYVDLPDTTDVSTLFATKIERPVSKTQTLFKLAK